MKRHLRWYEAGPALGHLCLAVLSHFQTQNLARFQHKWNDRANNHKRDEERRNGVKASPSELSDKECADDDADGAERIGHHVQVDAHHVVRVPVPVSMRVPVVVPVVVDMVVSMSM